MILLSLVLCVHLATPKKSVYNPFQMSCTYCNLGMKYEDTKKKDFEYVMSFKISDLKINVLDPKETSF